MMKARPGGDCAGDLFRAYGGKIFGFERCTGLTGGHLDAGGLAGRPRTVGEGSQECFGGRDGDVHTGEHGNNLRVDLVFDDFFASIIRRKTQDSSSPIS
jgi:hypothetical protein